jgi:hypothetical protein
LMPFVSCFISCFSELIYIWICTSAHILALFCNGYAVCVDHWLIAIFRAHWLKCCRDSKSSSSGLNNKCVNYPFVKTSFSLLALKSKHMKFSFFLRDMSGRWDQTTWL